MVTAASARQLQNNLQQAMGEFKKSQRGLQYYEQTGLQQSELIIKNANKSFGEGEISYIEWTMLMNNAVNIQLGYIDILKQYNQVLIELEYLTGK